MKKRVLVVNIGSLGEKELEIYMGRCPSNSRYDNHLGLTGTLDLINKLKPPPDLVIISEFGEEFSGLRADLCKAIKDVSNMPVIPASTRLHLRFSEDGNDGIDITIKCTGINCNKPDEPSNFKKDSEIEILERTKTEEKDEGVKKGEGENTDNTSQQSEAETKGEIQKNNRSPEKVLDYLCSECSERIKNGNDTS